jgi:hypothetical protein
VTYADLLLSIMPAQKNEIFKFRTVDDLMAYAQKEGLNFTQDQALKLVLKIKQHKNELTEEEKGKIAAAGTIYSEAPCRYCGSTTMELSVDSYGIYITCSNCKCNVIEI